jgi:hypothetical protein
VHQLFIDFKKAYDSIRKEILYNIIIEFGANIKIVRLIKMCLNETYCEVRIGKHLSESFLSKKGIKQPLPFDFALEYAIRKVQENQVGMKLNGKLPLLAYADGVTLLGDNKVTINKNTETVIDASKEIGLEINIGKTKYMLLSCYQNTGRNRGLKITNR